MFYSQKENGLIDKNDKYQSFVYIHIPKCGGTSFREFIFQSAKTGGFSEKMMYIPGIANGIERSKNIPALNPKELRQFKRERYTIVASHMRLGTVKSCNLKFNSPFYYIQYREPWQRFISHYNFTWRFASGSELEGVHINDLDAATLEDIVRGLANLQLVSTIDVPEMVRKKLTTRQKISLWQKNFMKKFTPPKPAGKIKGVGNRADMTWIEEAERLLRHQYGAFGILEEMELSLKFLQKASPKWLPFNLEMPFVNTTYKPDRDQPIKKEVLDLFTKYNKYDMILYERAKIIFHEKTNALSIG